jgi:putative redox protein
MGAFTTTYLGSLRCENLHEQSGTRILTDAPTDNQGKGSAFSPTDLCALSLTTCIITTMGIYANMKDFPILAAEATTHKHMANDPRRIARIEVHLTLTLAADATERQEEGLRRIANTCPVSRSLHPDIDQDVHLTFLRAEA